VASVKVELKLFTGKENFMLWQKRISKVGVVLVSKVNRSETMTNTEWEDLDELAKGFIEQHLTHDVFCNVMEDTAKQTWEKLEEMFASRSLSNKLFLKKELHSLKMKNGANMIEHVSAFNRCIANL
ncbi:unnamed protein product, partial [Prunus brigantina]